MTAPFWTQDVDTQVGATVCHTPSLSRFWSPQRIETLKVLTDQGYTGSQIAERLGVSRSAVLGMRFRMKIPSRNKGGGVSAPRPGRRKPRKTDEEKIIRLRPPTPIHAVPDLRDDDIPLLQRKRLIELENNHCRWPLGAAGDPVEFFCGAEGCDVIGRHPYCPSHFARSRGRSMTPQERQELRARMPATPFGQR